MTLVVFSSASGPAPGCGHAHEVTVTLSYDGIPLLPAPACRDCAGRMWEQARGDERMTVDILDPALPRGSVLRGETD